MYIIKHTESGEVVATYSKLPGRIDLTHLGKNKVFFSPQVGWKSDGYELVETTVPSSVVNALSEEEKLRRSISLHRNERIAAGQTITLSDGRTFTMQTRNEEDFRNINGMVSKAIVLTLQQSATTVSMNDAANVEQVFTPAQMIECGSLVGAKVDEIYKCSFKLKAMDPIPTDYNDDKYWDLTFYD